MLARQDHTAQHLDEQGGHRSITALDDLRLCRATRWSSATLPSLADIESNPYALFTSLD